jgi:hypothetical protein
MSTINTSEKLREAIGVLEKKRIDKGYILKDQLSVVIESVKPINLIKNTFKQVAESVQIKNDFLNAGLGMGAGYLAKLLFQALARSPLTKIVGSVLQLGVSTAAINNPEIINAVEERVLKLFSVKSKNNNHQQSESSDV